MRIFNNLVTSWLCPECRPNESLNRSSVVLTLEDEEENIDPPTSALTLNIVRKTQDDICDLNKKQRDIMHSISFCSDQISSFQMIINKVNDKLGLIEKLTQENISLKRDVLNLTKKVDTIQQLKSKNLKILGVPEKQGDNLHNVFSALVGKPKPIIVKFSQKVKRDEFLAASKIERKSIGSSSPGLKVNDVSN